MAAVNALFDTTFVVPPITKVLSFTTVVVASPLVVVPVTVKSPVTVKLSLIVTSEVEWPIVTGTPDVPVAIFTP